MNATPAGSPTSDSRDMNQQVVITGVGAVTGFGYGADALWQGLMEGRTTLRRIEAFDPSGFRCQIASEVTDFNVRDHVPKHYRKATKVMARDIELAVGAAKAAVEDARLVTRGTDEGATPTSCMRPRRRSNSARKLLICFVAVNPYRWYVHAHFGLGPPSHETAQLHPRYLGSRRHRLSGRQLVGHQQGVRRSFP